MCSSKMDLTGPLYKNPKLDSTQKTTNVFKTQHICLYYRKMLKQIFSEFSYAHFTVFKSHPLFFEKNTPKNARKYTLRDQLKLLGFYAKTKMRNMVKIFKDKTISKKYFNKIGQFCKVEIRSLKWPLFLKFQNLNFSHFCFIKNTN